MSVIDHECEDESSKTLRKPERYKETLFECINKRIERRCHNNVCKLVKNHLPFLNGFKLMEKLPVHDGCVNTICWNKTSQYILSGSDDGNLCITKPESPLHEGTGYTVLNKIQTRHLGNIFSVKFLPQSNDSVIVSCSSNGPVLVHDINHLKTPTQSIYNFNCHWCVIFRIVTPPDEAQTFLSCGQDKTVRLFDLRCHKSCYRASTCPHPALIKSSQPITTLSIHPNNSNLLLVGRSDGVGLLYDRRKLPDVRQFSREKAHEEYLANQNGSGNVQKFAYVHPMEGVLSTFKVPHLDNMCKLSTLAYSPSGDQILASYSNDYVYLFNQDRSSNFQMIQTIRSEDSTLEMRPNDGRPARREESKNLNFPRMRVRGDWSDTGVNSIPNSTARDETSAQHARNMFARMAEVALGSHSRRNHTIRFIPTSDNMNVLQNINPRTSEQINTIEDSSGDNIDITPTTSVTSSEINNHHEKQRESSVKPNLKPKTRMNFEAALAKLKDKYSNIPTYNPSFCYRGHRNSRTIIKDAVFWGDRYVMSGSDCGRIMVWEKNTAKLVMCFPADRRVVNCLAPSPDLYALASSGLDNDIKLWSTQRESFPFMLGDSDLEEIINNNEIMLNEARRTVIVPPHFIFRVLETLSRNN